MERKGAKILFSRWIICCEIIFDGDRARKRALEGKASSTPRG